MVYYNTLLFCLYIQTQAVYLPDWVLGPTVMTVDLSYKNSIQVLYMLLSIALEGRNVTWKYPCHTKGTHNNP